MKKTNKGFTLIELLIVIAILATLAIVVLLALDPVQQLARTRDSGRSSTVTQLGHAIEANATATRNGAYQPDGAGCAVANLWITNCLVNSGEIKIVPNNPLYPTLAAAPACPGGTVAQSAAGGSPICYDATATNFVVFVRAEAKTNQALCTVAGQLPYFTYSSAAGRGGIICGAAAPTAGATNFVN